MVAGTRCRRTLETRTRGRWSKKGKNRAFIRGGGDLLKGRGGRNATPINLVGVESQDPIMNKVCPEIRWKTLEESFK